MCHERYNKCQPAFRLVEKCSLRYCQRYWEIYIEEMVSEKKVQAGNVGLLGMVPPRGEKHVRWGSDTKRGISYLEIPIFCNIPSSSREPLT